MSDIPIGHAQLTRKSVRARLLKMTDDQLRRYGRAAAYMCSPPANLGEPPLEAYTMQLEEARAEWRRRHGCDDG